MNRLLLCCFVVALGSCATHDKAAMGRITFFIDETTVTDAGVRNDFYRFHRNSKKWIAEEFSLPTEFVIVGEDDVSAEINSALQASADCSIGIYISRRNRDRLICSAISDYDLHQILSE